MKFVWFLVDVINLTIRIGDNAISLFLEFDAGAPVTSVVYHFPTFSIMLTYPAMISDATLSGDLCPDSPFATNPLVGILYHDQLSPRILFNF